MNGKVNQGVFENLYDDGVHKVKSRGVSPAPQSPYMQAKPNINNVSRLLASGGRKKSVSESLYMDAARRREESQERE